MPKSRKPKVRHTWGINPVSRIKPNKQKVKNSNLCPDCEGTGVGFGFCDNSDMYQDCHLCNGTGLI
jgi:DnaJ-class molecular chaperone